MDSKNYRMAEENFNFSVKYTLKELICICAESHGIGTLKIITSCQLFSHWKKKLIIFLKENPLVIAKFNVSINKSKQTKNE